MFADRHANNIALGSYRDPFLRTFIRKRGGSENSGCSGEGEHAEGGPCRAA
jgi:hypothetical protein